MTRVVLHWLGAVALSLGANAALLLILARAIAPDDEMHEQAMPRTRLDLAAQKVHRAAPQPQAPKADAAAQAQPSRPAAAQGAVPRDSATSLAPRASPARAARPDAIPAPTYDAAPQSMDAKEAAPETLAPRQQAPAELAAAPPQPETVPSASHPTDQALVPAQTAAKSVSVSPPPSQAARPPEVIAAVPAVPAEARPAAIASAQPAAATAAALRPPTGAAQPSRPVPAAPVSASIATGRIANTVTPTADAVPPAAVPAPPGRKLAAAAPDVPATPTPTDSSPQLPVEGQKAKAALAWSGADDNTIDPVSLAAIAAFSRPGEIDPSGGEPERLRDGIAGILASVPCARLQATFIPETGTLQLRGHVPEDGLKNPVRDALRAQLGDSIPIDDQLRILPRPQCGALSGIAAVGLPQSNEQLTNPRVIGPNAFVRNYDYGAGDRLEFSLEAPEYRSFIHVDYFDADGMVIHLQPNDTVPLEPVAPETELTIGRPRAGKPSLNITIAPPFGQEIAVAFATSHRLYDETRPLIEPAGPYLEFLRARVARARQTNPGFKGEWVYFFITTRPAAN